MGGIYDIVGGIQNIKSLQDISKVLVWFWNMGWVSLPWTPKYTCITSSTTRAPTPGFKKEQTIGINSDLLHEPKGSHKNYF
jgi:hypothetical protein